MFNMFLLTWAIVSSLCLMPINQTHKYNRNFYCLFSSVLMQTTCWLKPISLPKSCLPLFESCFNRLTGWEKFHLNFLFHCAVSLHPLSNSPFFAPGNFSCHAIRFFFSFYPLILDTMLVSFYLVPWSFCNFFLFTSFHI